MHADQRLEKCNAKKTYAIPDKFAEIRDNLKIMLESTKIIELANDVGKGLTYLSGK